MAGVTERLYIRRERRSGALLNWLFWRLFAVRQIMGPAKIFPGCFAKTLSLAVGRFEAINDSKEIHSPTLFDCAPLCF